MSTSATPSGDSRDSSTDAAARTRPRVDRDVVAFFAIAYTLAWTIWLVMAWAAADTGRDTASFVALVEAGELNGIATPLPGWGLYLLSRIADFSFSIAGIVMIVATAGSAGLRLLARRLTAWRVAPRWYAVALLPVALYLAAAIVVTASEGGRVLIDLPVLRTILFSLSAGLFVSLFLRGAMGEELGLRGFVLPRLQARTTPLRASLIIGVLWGLWHLPVLVGRDPVSVIAFFLLALSLSFLFTRLFNRTSGSLVPALLLHATVNWEEAFETVFPAVRGTDWETIPIVVLIVAGFVAARGLSATVDRHSLTTA